MWISESVACRSASSFSFAMPAIRLNCSPYRFADWMIKDVQTGEIFRADHLVEAVIESRLKGDKEARGVKDEPVAEEDGDKKKKKKKSVKSVAVKLDDEVVAEYESLLAQVGFSSFKAQDISDI